VSSKRFIDLTAFDRTNNTVWVMAQNVSGATFDLTAAMLSIGGDEAAGAVSHIKCADS
jgi:hypothetical protein